MTKSVQSYAKLANYMGMGQDPNITLKLGDNGCGWGGYTLNYGGVGNVPGSTDSAKNWSVWDAYDEFGHYYGSITLTSNGKQVDWGKYVDGQNGYYFDGITLVYNNKQGAYQLGVKNIVRPELSSPFPDAPPATPAKYLNTDTRIQFLTQGNKLVNNCGEEILLKGVVRPSLEWNAQGSNLSPEDIANMAKWGSNAVRLDLDQQKWFASQSADVMGSYKQIIDAIIYYATQNQMAVILDLHWTEIQGQSPMANKDSLTFWKEVAQTYKDFGTVIFELFNEPNAIAKEVWLNGDNNHYVGYQELYDTVRATGATNPVIIAGTDWGYDLSFVNKDFGVKGENIIYCSHPYDDKGKPGYQGPGGDFDNCLKGVINDHPIIFTEFGDNQPTDYQNGNYKSAYQNTLDYVNKHNIHYTAFAWFVDAPEPYFPTLISDWDGTPINGGVLVHDDLQQKPGTKLFISSAQLQVNQVENHAKKIQNEDALGKMKSDALFLLTNKAKDNTNPFSLFTDPKRYEILARHRNPFLRGLQYIFGNDSLPKTTSLKLAENLCKAYAVVANANAKANIDINKHADHLNQVTVSSSGLYPNVPTTPAKTSTVQNAPSAPSIEAIKPAEKKEQYSPSAPSIEAIEHAEKKEREDKACKNLINANNFIVNMSDFSYANIGEIKPTADPLISKALSFNEDPSNINIFKI